MLNNKYFVLFANCIPVKGYKRSIVCDLLRNKYVFITNDLYKILKEYKNLSIGDIKKKYNNEYDNFIDEYFQYLLKNNLIFLCDKNHIKNFPEISLNWEDSCIISNAIIEINKDFEIDIRRIISQLNDVSCKNLQIKFLNSIDVDYLKYFLSLFENTTILYVECIFPYSSNLKTDDVVNLFKLYPRLYNCYIYNSDFFNITTYNDLGNIVFIKDNLAENESCGFIHPNNFTINIDFFIESNNYNSCLNRKVVIDYKGNVKNCLLMDNEFGNIMKDNLIEIVKSVEFQKLWPITKDQIAICKDCEFRYICPDCRVCITNKEDILSKPLNCTYNPYTAKEF